MAGLVLAVFDRLSWLVRLLGGDHARFRAILRVKLIVDDRREHGVLGMPGRSSTRGFLTTLAFYALMGAPGGGFLVEVESPTMALLLANGFLLAVLTMALISDYTDVVVDSADTATLGHLPVSARTVLLARLAHIAVYLGLSGVAVSAFTLVVGSVRLHPLFAPVYLATLAAMLVFVVAVAVSVLLLLMRWTDVERFKDVVLYFQIGSMLFILFAYLGVSEALDYEDFRSGWAPSGAWTWLLPPCWFSAPIELLLGDDSPPVLMRTAVAVVVPANAAYLLVHVLAPSFQRLVDREAREGRESVRAEAPVRRPQGPALLLRRAFLRSPEERLGFDLCARLSARDRLFKSQVYPWMAILVGLPLLGLLGEGSEIVDKLAHSPHSLVLLYAIALATPIATFDLTYTRDARPAWMYEALPIRARSEVILGGIKAVLVRFTLPLFAVYGLFFAAAFGWRGLLDTVLVLAVSVCAGLLAPIAVGRWLPFSQEISLIYKGGTLKRMSVFGLCMLAPYLLHRLAYENAGARLLALAVVLLLAGLLLRAYRPR